MFPTQHHSRSFGAMRYVYPVVSRRSGGVSVGINLNPTGACTFACVYCQVLAEAPKQPKGTFAPPGSRAARIDLDRLESELREVLDVVQSGALFTSPGLAFPETPLERRVLRDIAFSGDGEPTLAAQFPQAVKIAATARRECCPTTTKLVLITNATRLHMPRVRAAVGRLVQENGEIWAKLDAGAEAFYKRVARSRVPFERIVRNITDAARFHPIVIQTCLFRRENKTPSDAGFAAYLDCLNAIRAAGGMIDRVQLYTVARKTPDPTIKPLADGELDGFATTCARETELRVEAFYSR